MEVTTEMESILKISAPEINADRSKYEAFIQVVRIVLAAAVVSFSCECHKTCTIEHAGVLNGQRDKHRRCKTLQNLSLLIR